MFRITQSLKELISPIPTPSPTPKGPVVIWNLTRKCNLNCLHCYALAANSDFKGELSTEEAFRVLDDLHGMNVPALILSGGEPLLRPDIFDIARRAKELGMVLTLSTNGALIDASNIDRIAAVGFDYVGISFDGMRTTHDTFRRQEGCFDASLHGMRLCRDKGIRTGVRFTLTQQNAADLPPVLEMVDAEGIGKFYLSHLNYAGRGKKNRRDDAHVLTTRATMDYLFDRAWSDLTARRPLEYVSGNNDADAVFLLQWAMQRFHHEDINRLRQKLRSWGGNATGVNIGNIDNVGNIHPDTYWWDYTIGNVREKPFSQQWKGSNDPILTQLRRKPRPLTGRCGECAYMDICGGNTRTRALSLTGNLWSEDPGCYLYDDEIAWPMGDPVGARA